MTEADDSPPRVTLPRPVGVAGLPYGRNEAVELANLQEIQRWVCHIRANVGRA
ncbi:MAG TPA: hypothetical protein VM889_11495 [Candidatus Thermoplasmatota archaeon]|nr:hypothetical protein [Candidatus Thermoplasmatota archaeon]